MHGPDQQARANRLFMIGLVVLAIVGTLSIVYLASRKVGWL